MGWNRGLRIGRTPAVGALVAAGVVGAALLASPMVNSRAADGFGDTYYNGGFCYQNEIRDENTYRLHFSEPSYDPNSNVADLTFTVQKWDDSSNQYQDERVAFTIGSEKLSLTNEGYFGDASKFCEAKTRANAAQLGGDVYPHGEYTSSRTVGESKP